MTGLDGSALLRARLRAQHLNGAGLAGVADVVRTFGAVQGQEFRPALWGLARRCAPTSVPPGEALPAGQRRPGASESLALFDDGGFLRTHVLRPTWHLVAPDDARWLLALTGPRVHRTNGTMYRRFDVPEVAKAVDVVAELVAERPRTRAELAEGLAERGIDTTAPPPEPGRPGAGPGITLGLLLMRAELDGVVISGPLQGRNQTYAPFDERVPAGYGPLGATYDEEAALAELVRRYLATRAAATVKDLAGWSSLTLAQVRRGLAAVSDDVGPVHGTGDLEGLTFWHLLDTDPRDPDPAPPGGVDLLQAYDELFLSYTESRFVALDPAAAPLVRPGAYVHLVVADGRVVGRWRWPAGGPEDAAALDVQWLRDPGPELLDGLESARTALAAHLAG